MESQLLMCVERRLAYASIVGRAAVLDRAECVEVLSNSSDISKGIMAFSADIAAVLYPLFLSTTNQHKRRMLWRRIPIKRVPGPLLLFLHQVFPDTDWNSVFFRGIGGRPMEDPAYLCMEKVRTDSADEATQSDSVSSAE